MADEMEQIEARLAAYIDDTLPAPQRAEIEGYLKANPAHATLIAELVALKSAVAGLPREKAPAEVLDGLQSQIERHALLDADEDDAPAMRLSRWPAFGSAAAVLLLAGGLGLLVYQVLPKPKADLAMSTTTRPGEVQLSDAAPAYADKPVQRPTGGLSKRSAMAAKAESATAPAAFGFDAVTAGSTIAAPAAADDSPTRTDVAGGQRFALNGNPANGPVELAMQSQQAPGNAALGLANQTPLATAMATNPHAYFGSIATAVTVSDPVRVVIVRSDDPALTQNLFVASLVAEKTAFELADWPTTAPATQQAPARPTVGELLTRLYGSGELAADDANVTGTRPVVLRGVTGDQAYSLRNTLNSQRPARQRAEWAGQGKADLSKVELARSADRKILAAASKPTSAADHTPGAMASTTAPATVLSRTVSGEAVSVVDTLFDLRPPTTSPATLSTTSPATRPMPSSDLVVLVLARPAPTTAPETPLLPPTTPATRP